MESMKVFLSSTFYDLKQIRSDLMDFFINIGFTPILSEYPNFPINPDKNTIDNCIENVRNNTDIFVLIIGNRYGSQIDRDKSITNTEYLYAKSLGIPTYIFIAKSVLAIIPFWEKNKTGDFTNIVDSVKLFEFIQSIRETDKKWCFEFEKAQDIITVLKVQLPHLFKEAIELQRKFSTNLPDFYKKLSSESINILLKKDTAFEIFYFAQCLEDELKKFDNQKYDLEYQIKYGSTDKIANTSELQIWISKKLDSINNLVESASTLVNDAFKNFFGELGIQSDLKGLYYVACGLARVFQELLNWHQNILSTTVNEDYITLKNSFAKYALNAINAIWDFPSKIRNEISSNLDKIKNGDESVIVSIELTINIDQEASKSFLNEIKRLKE